MDEKTTNYYYGGAFYEKRSDGYVVVAPMAGSVVEHISEGGEEVKMGDADICESLEKPTSSLSKEMERICMKWQMWKTINRMSSQLSYLKYQ